MCGILCVCVCKGAYMFCYFGKNTMYSMKLPSVLSVDTINSFNINTKKRLFHKYVYSMTCRQFVKSYLSNTCDGQRHRTK